MDGFTTKQANVNLQQLANTPTQFSGDAADLARSQRLAELLSSSKPAEGQMVSGRFVAPSWTQQLNTLAQAGLGAYYGSKAEEQQTKLAEKLREDKMATLEAINTAIDTGDLKKARAIATSRPEYGKEFIAPLLANINPKPTELKQNYEDWLASGGKGTLLDYQRYAANLKQEHPSFAPFESNGVMYTMNSRTGQAVPILDPSGKPLSGKGKTLTEAEGKATTYQGTMMNAAKDMKSLEEKGYNPSSFKNQAQLTAPNVSNIVLPADTQQYKQAMDGFANAYLRFQSGANMAQDEIQRNLRNMMPAFGDKPAVIKQKADARNEAIRFMSYSAGQGSNMLQQAMPNAPSAPSMPSPAVPAATPAAAPVANKAPMVFTSESDAAKAKLKDGTPIVINGVPGTWKN